jgi:hypothetical protein
MKPFSRVRFGLYALGLVLGLALAQSPVPQPSLEALKGIDASRAMELANAWGVAKAPVQSFVTPQAVNFEIGGKKAQVALPTDRMVVAVAPYINRTHPCKTHYMSSCQGELAGTLVEVQVTQNGKEVIKGTVKTLENGFLELWLPRNQSYQLNLKAKGLSATGLISTFNNSDTCVTTFQLR